MSKIPDRSLAALKQLNVALLTHMEAVIFLLEIEALAVKDANVRNAYSTFEKATAELKHNPRTYLRCSLFSLQISAMEIFIQDLLRAVLAEHPKKMGSTQFKLTEILEFTSHDQAIERATEDFLNRIMYKKPLEYLDEISEILSIDKTPLLKLWPALVEAKARRDLGVHNNWLCNETYLRKVKEAGLATTAKKGDSLAPADHDYFKRVGDALGELGYMMASEVGAKYA